MLWRSQLRQRTGSGWKAGCSWLCSCRAWRPSRSSSRLVPSVWAQVHPNAFNYACWKNGLIAAKGSAACPPRELRCAASRRALASQPSTSLVFRLSLHIVCLLGLLPCPSSR